MIDDVARIFAITENRRQLIRMVGRGLAGGALAGFALGSAAPADARCKNWILSGGVDPNTPIAVDDDLKITLGQTVLLEDTNGSASQHAPIHFQAKRGQRLRVTATNVQIHCRSLSPIYIHCETGGSPRRLTAGVAENCNADLNGVFFNKRFEI
jgi:hypothetical protein